MNDGLNGSGQGGHRLRPASEILLERFEDATIQSLQRIHDVTRSAGHLDGGEITDGGGGTINVSGGSGFIRAVNDDVSKLFTFDWKPVIGLVIPTDTLRFVSIDFNNGRPQIIVSASEGYDYRTGFPLGFVVNEAGTLFINDTPHSVGRAIGRLLRRNYEVDGRSRANALGGLIINEAGTKQVQITGGTTWLRGLREVFPAFDSTGADRWDNYYRDGVGGFTKEATQATLPLNLYDDGSGTLQLVGNNNRAVYWFYLGPSNGVVMVYGRGNHNQLTDALNEPPPSSLPIRLQTGAILLGRFVTLRNVGTSTVEAVESAFTQLFVGGGVTDHGALAGLGDDDHLQYHTDARGDARYPLIGTVVTSVGGSSPIVSSGGTAPVISLNQALLAIFTDIARGVVPPSGGGTSNFLRADGAWTTPPAGGAGNFGTAILNFGAFPGSSHATVAVTGQGGILAGSVVRAWVRPVASADHSSDEHMLETLKVHAADIIPGVGFTIHGFNESEIFEDEPPSWMYGGGQPLAGARQGGAWPATYSKGQGTRLYGQFNVAWNWA